MISVQRRSFLGGGLPEIRERYEGRLSRDHLTKDEVRGRLLLGYNRDKASVIKMLEQVGSVSVELFDVLKLTRGDIRDVHTL